MDSKVKAGGKDKAGEGMGSEGGDMIEALSDGDGGWQW